MKTTLRLSNRLGNLHVASPFILAISSLSPKPWQKIGGVAVARLHLRISGRPPLPSTRSSAPSRPKKGRICPFPHLLGRGCDDGGEGGSAGPVNRKPGSSGRGVNLHFRAPLPSQNKVFLQLEFTPTAPQGNRGVGFPPSCHRDATEPNSLRYQRLRPGLRCWRGFLGFAFFFFLAALVFLAIFLHGPSSRVV